MSMGRPSGHGCTWLQQSRLREPDWSHWAHSEGVIINRMAIGEPKRSGHREVEVDPTYKYVWSTFSQEAKRRIHPN